MSQSAIPSEGPTPSQKSKTHYHHGKTPAAWAGSLIGTLAFIVGGVGFALQPLSPLFWVGVGLMVVAVIATVVLRQVGLGAN